jgi:hypothetical protein
MTITTESVKVVAQGNSATVTWPWSFLIPALDDLVVTLVDRSSGNETVLAPSQFSVTGLGDPNGGSVTYPLSGSPLTTATDIVVERFLPEVQETDLTNQGGAYPEDIEDALDYLTMICQQLQDQINRAIVFSVADTVESTLPVASARANLFLAFDSNGAPIAVAGLAGNVIVSAAMIPVVTAPTTADALIALGITSATFIDLLIPSGVCWDYNAGGAAPAGFVYPTGQACTAALPDYRAKLIAAGSPYGNNGTDPLMPDYRSIVSAGRSNMNGVDNGLLTGGTVLGAVLGVQSKTLVGGNLPAYTPTGAVNITDPTHTHTATTDGQHIGVSAGPIQYFGGPQNLVFDTVTVNAAATGVTAAFVGNAQGGTSTPFSIVQPTFICNKILKVH